MISDEAKIILIVTLPLSGFTILILLAFTWRQYQRIRYLQECLNYEKTMTQSSSCSTCSARTAINARNQAPTLPALSHLSNAQTANPDVLIQPHFDEKSLDIRRISIHPQSDEVKRVNSISSTLTLSSPTRDTTNPQRASVASIPPVGVVDGNHRLSIFGGHKEEDHDMHYHEKDIEAGWQSFNNTEPLSPVLPREHPFARTSTSHAPFQLQAPPTPSPKSTLPVVAGPPLASANETQDVEPLFSGWSGFTKPDSSLRERKPSLSKVPVLSPVPESAEKTNENAEPEEKRRKSSQRITYLADVVAEEKPSKQ